MAEQSQVTTSKRSLDRSGELAWGADDHPWKDEVASSSGVAVENGTVQPGSTIPSSVIAHYDASQESYSDGDSVSTITDQAGEYDLSGGSATYVSNAINDSPAFRFSGSAHENTSLLVSQPNAIVALAKTTTPSNDGEYVTDGIDGRQILAFNLGSTHYESGIYASSFVGGGSSTTDFTILSGIYDGANSEFRRNEAVTGTGNVGSNDLDGLVVGALNGDIVEVLVLSDPTDVGASEQYLKDNHGL